ncbi:hypothetical protein IQ244_01200 [Nostoc sp. LEGE 06077]|nr:hypothetical protein [Nostoc sp. LEGE 06077]
MFNTSRLELKFQAHSQSPQSVDWKIFLVESSEDDYFERMNIRKTALLIEGMIFVSRKGAKSKSLKIRIL